MRRGNKSAGSVITSVDHDCCPKKAMLNSTIAQRTSVIVTRNTHGMSTRAGAERDLAGSVEREAAVQQPARECSTDEAADARGGIRNPGVVADLLRVELVHVEQVLWQPEAVKEPGARR